MAPAASRLARWAVKYGPALLPVAQRLYEQGRWRQLAILHARTLVDGTFSWEMVDGSRVWAVWTGDELVATYPEVAGATAALAGATRPERRQSPDDLRVQRLLRRVADTPRPRLPRRSDDD